MAGIISNAVNANKPTAEQANTFATKMNAFDWQGAADYGRSLGYTDDQIATYTGGQGFKDDAGNIITAQNAADWMKTKTAATPSASAAAAPPVTAPTAAGVTAAQTTVDPKTMTVQGQLQGIVDPNSALGQQAVTQGLQMANDRGLINSSIAQTAAQDSLYRTALPIAQQDAGTYANVGLQNTNAQNTVNLANQSNTTQRYGIDKSAETARYTADKSAETALRTQQMNIDATKALNISNQDFQKYISSSTGATNIVTNLQTQLTAIDRDSNITDPNAKQIAKTNAITVAKTGLQLVGAAGGDVNFAQYVDSLLPRT